MLRTPADKYIYLGGGKGGRGGCLLQNKSTQKRKKSFFPSTHTLQSRTWERSFPASWIELSFTAREIRTHPQRTDVFTPQPCTHFRMARISRRHHTRSSITALPRAGGTDGPAAPSLRLPRGSAARARLLAAGSTRPPPLRSPPGTRARPRSLPPPRSLAPPGAARRGANKV